jgi:hypothetical protein
MTVQLQALFCVRPKVYVADALAGLCIPNLKARVGAECQWRRWVKSMKWMTLI